MEVKLIEEALSGILELREPWYIEKVDVHHKNAVVDIYIRYKRGANLNAVNAVKIAVCMTATIADGVT